MKKIKLWHRKNAVKSIGKYALVDDEDYNLLNVWTWSYQMIRSAGSFREYAGSKIHIEGKHRAIRMHQLITGYKETDHIDGNGLNNQKNNLRPATRSQNTQNKRKKAGIKSQYKGITFSKKWNKWVANIWENGKQHYLGAYKSEEEAAMAYDQAAKQRFGEYARLNFAPQNK